MTTSLARSVVIEIIRQTKFPENKDVGPTDAEVALVDAEVAQVVAELPSVVGEVALETLA